MQLRYLVSNETERRLQEWAIWSKKKGRGIGYPKRSIEGRLRDEGVILPRKRYQPETFEHPAAEEIENLIVLMSKTLVLQAKVLRDDYLDNTPTEIKMRRLQMSRPKYALYRDSGKSWLEGQLQARTEYNLPRYKEACNQ